jgi:hypothetical protein
MINARVFEVVDDEKSKRSLAASFSARSLSAVPNSAMLTNINHTTQVDHMSVHHLETPSKLPHWHAVCPRWACASEPGESIYRKELGWRMLSTLNSFKTRRNSHQHMNVSYQGDEEVDIKRQEV